MASYRGRQSVRPPSTRAAGLTRLDWFIFGALVAASSGARIWSFTHASVRIYVDSLAYATQARHPLASTFLWAGYKPPLTALLLKVVGDVPSRYTVLQLVLAMASWGLLAAIVTATLRTRPWLRLAAGTTILGLSLTQTIALWDRAVLSESIAFSLLAVVVANGILLAARPTRWRAAWFLLALAGWVAVRDSNATAVAGLGIALVVGVLLRRVDRRMLAVALGAFSIVALSFWSASHGVRGFYPTAQVIRVRILATDEGYRWLARRHPPQLEAVYAASRVGRAVEAQPGFEAWDAWTRSAGQATVIRWLADHPSEVFLAPLAHPEAVIANVPTAYYSPAGYRPFLGPLDSLLWMPGWLVPALLTLIALVGVRLHHPRPTALLWVAILCAALALPHAWLAYLLNPMEAARHALVAQLQYRLGLLVVLPVAWEGILDRFGALQDGRHLPLPELTPADALIRADAA